MSSEVKVKVRQSMETYRRNSGGFRGWEGGGGSLPLSKHEAVATVCGLYATV